MNKRHTAARIAAVSGVVLVLLAAALKPGDRARAVVAPSDPAADYFTALNRELRTEAHGLPCAVIDLDRLDRNIGQVKKRIGTTRALRLVAKSLPSLDLLDYLLKATFTRRLMVFHLPQVPLLLEKFGDLDILLGKPMPADSVRAALTEHPGAAAHVQWLVDTPERLDEYLTIAHDLKTRLKISLELDVGLRRGGVETLEELGALLARLAANPAQAEFTGFMGYDGHVAHAPGILSFGKERAVRQAFEKVLARYADFVAAGRKSQPGWFSGAAGEKLVLNGAGSRTYAMYTGAETPINDLALGSALLKPADFDEPTLASHEPALFLAVPILKKLSTPPLPFLEPFWPALAAWDPNLARGFYLYGSVWDSDIVSPPGLAPGWYYEPAIRNLLPNQSLLSGSSSVKAEVGDYVFLRPREGDAIVAFGDILAVRGGHVEARWHPLAVRN